MRGRRDTPIDELILFSGQIDVQHQIYTSCCLYWHRLLHLTDNNLLYKIIQSHWFEPWKQRYNNNGNNKKYILSTYQKQSILWKWFSITKQLQLVENANFINYNNYSMFHKLPKYSYPIQYNNTHITIIYEEYTDHCKYANKLDTMYAFPDGSIKNDLGGFGICYECIDQVAELYVMNILKIYSILRK